jgi:hypothetical protein
MSKSNREDRKRTHRSYDKVKTKSDKKNAPPSKVFIYTKEWTKTKGGVCQKCRTDSKNYLWLCFDTSAGPIKLCSSCFKEACQRSFESADPLDFAWSGGDFSGNS